MGILGIAAIALWCGGCSLLFDPAPGTAIDAGTDDDDAEVVQTDEVQVWSGSTALHTCASKGPRVVCWGDNTYGQLGDGGRTAGSAENKAESYIPLTFTSEVVEMTLAYGHTCALLGDGKVYCWGANAEGQLGLSSSQDQGAPVVAVQLSMTGEAATHISAGDDHTCASLASGKMRCWGNVSRFLESYSELNTETDNLWGDDEHPDTKPDIPVTFPIRALGVGATHGCAIAQMGDMVECWGAFQGVANEPFEDLPYNRAASVASGALFACLLDADGKINCWGNDDSLQLGTATNPYPEPLVGQVLQFNGGDVAQQVVAGAYHACARFANGTVHCWGRASNGAIGSGSSTDVGGDILTLFDTEVDFDEAAVSIAAGVYHTCVAFVSGAVRCFGNNQQGQMGSGTSCAALGGDGNDCNYGDDDTELPINAEDMIFFD